MISKQETGELIFAGVLGCLDRADQTRLTEYIKSGGELPPDVGEFQNIAALLPLILKPEIPDSQLKDKVARKLYRIKDELRAKISPEAESAAEDFYKNSRANRKLHPSTEKPSAVTEPEKSVIEDKKDEIKNEEPEKIHFPQSEQVSVKEINNKEIKPETFEPVTPVRNAFESFKSTREKVIEGKFDVPAEDQKQATGKEIKSEPKIETGEKISTMDKVTTKEKIPYKTPTKESSYYQKTTTKDRGKSIEKTYKKRFVTGDMVSAKKSFMNSKVIISLFIILFLIIAAGFLYFASEMKDLKVMNIALRQQVNDLSVKYNSTAEIQSLIESADVKIINLEGTEINPDGKGKVIISFTQNKGYLQLSDMPGLGEDKSYELWMQLPAGDYFSLGLFSPAGRVQYFPFKIPQSEARTATHYIVTEESSTGASKPGSNVFLEGNTQ